MIQEKEIRPDSHPADARLDRFDRDGFVVIEDALSGEQIHRYRELHRVIYEQEQAAGRLASSPGGSNRPGAMHSFGFVLRHPDYLELLDLPSVFPLVCDILGWNIYMYHCHIDQHPPVSGPLAPVWGWHQDGGRQNLEVDGDGVRPRLSVKAGYFLSDVSEPNRGNMLVVPGSHRWSVLPRPAHPERGFAQPRGAVPVCARPGTAVVFDRRLWHSRSDNRSTVIR